MDRLIIRPGGIGDGLLLAPALAALRRESDGRIGLVGYPERLRPLQAAGLVDSLYPLDRWTLACKDLLAEWPGNPLRIDTFFPNDGAIRIPADPVEVHYHLPTPPEDRPVHLARHYAQALGVEIEEGISSLACLVAKRETRSNFWIHPGAGAKEKRWPFDSFLRIAERIQKEKPVSVVFLVGEAEEDLVGKVEKAGFRVQRPETLADWIREVGAGDGFLGNDSGFTHLAALLGLQTVAVFGPTDPTVWGPWGKRTTTLGPDPGGSWPCLKTVQLGVKVRVSG